jgi:hypothetical protein
MKLSVGGDHPKTLKIFFNIGTLDNLSGKKTAVKSRGKRWGYSPHVSREMSLHTSAGRG